jgi:hypothetical protein
LTSRIPANFRRADLGGDDRAKFGQPEIELKEQENLRDRKIEQYWVTPADRAAGRSQLKAE